MRPMWVTPRAGELRREAETDRDAPTPLMLETSTEVVINIDAEVVGTLDDDVLAGSADSDRMIGGDGWDRLAALGDDDIL